jgi:hypothetical protein
MLHIYYILYKSVSLFHLYKIIYMCVYVYCYKVSKKNTVNFVKRIK